MVSGQLAALYIKLNEPVAEDVKVTVATPDEVVPKDAPVGLPDCAVQDAVVGLVPVSTTLDPAHVLWSLPALDLPDTTTLAVSGHVPVVVQMKLYVPTALKLVIVVEALLAVVIVAVPGLPLATVHTPPVAAVAAIVANDPLVKQVTVLSAPALAFAETLTVYVIELVVQPPVVIRYKVIVLVPEVDHDTLTQLLFEVDGVAFAPKSHSYH
jgi:hypothetical protein